MEEAEAPAEVILGVPGEGVEGGTTMEAPIGGEALEEVVVGAAEAGVGEVSAAEEALAALGGDLLGVVGPVGDGRKESLIVGWSTVQLIR